MILSIYYSLLPFFKNKEIKSIIDILKEVFGYKKFEIQYHLDNKEDLFESFANGLKSKRTKLSVPQVANDSNDDDDEIVFHESFINLLDIIHLSLSIHFPLIIEGEVGSGKKTAINYISKKLGYKLIHYQITESTTIEELLGKEVIKPDDEQLFFLEKSELFNAVIEEDFITNSTNENKKYDEFTIIFIENIEHASPYLLEAMIPFFDNSLSEILLPFGQEGKKKPFNLIVTYDPTKHSSSFENFIPIQILNNSLIFKFQNPNENDYLNIYKQLSSLQENEEESNIQKIIKNFINSKYFSTIFQGKELFTINDLKKYNIFRENIDNKDNNDIISKLIFTSKFANKKQKEDLENKLKLKKSNLNLKIGFDNENDNDNYSYFSIYDESDEKSKGNLSKFEYSTPIDDKKKDLFEKSFNNLSKSQKLGILFLLLSFETKMTCIIQGPFCSGKTHLIKVFSKICDKEIEIIDLSNESNLSLLTGKLTPSYKISKHNEEELQNLLKKGLQKTKI